MVRIGRPGWWFKFGEHTAKPTEDHGNRDEANAVRPPDEKLRSPLADPRALFIVVSSLGNESTPPAPLAVFLS